MATENKQPIQDQIKTRNVDPAELSLQGESIYAAIRWNRVHAQTHNCALCERNLAVLVKAIAEWIYRPDAAPKQEEVKQETDDPFGGFDNILKEE